VLASTGNRNTVSTREGVEAAEEEEESKDESGGESVTISNTRRKYLEKGAEEKAKKEAEEKAKKEAEEKAKKEAEERSKNGAEERSKKEAEERSKKEAEERSKKEAEEVQGRARTQSLNPFVCPEPGCNRSFKSAMGLEHHIEWHSVQHQQQQASDGASKPAAEEQLGKAGDQEVEKDDQPVAKTRQRAKTKSGLTPRPRSKTKVMAPPPGAAPEQAKKLPGPPPARAVAMSSAAAAAAADETPPHLAN
jgi:hypothetical protein